MTHESRMCELCGKEIESYSSNPNLWCVELPRLHPEDDERGILYAYHYGCVLDRMLRFEELKNSIDESIEAARMRGAIVADQNGTLLPLIEIIGDIMHNMINSVAVSRTWKNLSENWHRLYLEQNAEIKELRAKVAKLEQSNGKS